VVAAAHEELTRPRVMAVIDDLGARPSPAGLHQPIRSIVVDAFLVLVMPLAVNSPVAAIRFTSTRTYWTELFPRLDIDSVRREAVGRAEVIARYGLAPTTVVALRELRRPRPRPGPGPIGRRRRTSCGRCWPG
jgi:hypothetical protein